MLLIIDAYNVLKQASSAQFIEEGQRNAFVKKIEKYAHARNNRVILVFDGGDYYRPATYKYGLLTVMYAGQNDSADDVIKQLVIKGVNPAQTILVSSDRELCAYVSNFKVHSLDSREFYKMLHAQINNPAHPECFRRKCIEGEGCCVNGRPFVMQKGSGAIKKINGHESTDELDALMMEASKAIMHKTEDDYKQDRKSSAQQITKQEKKIKRLVKKL